jgi:hypothetical protein
MALGTETLLIIFVYKFVIGNSLVDIILLSVPKCIIGRYARVI